ncbi:MAG: hypothetical protein ACJ76I_06205 [Gaiellaceae bacterium]
MKVLYHPHHRYPREFYIPEIAVIAASGILAFESAFGVVVAPLGLLFRGRRRQRNESSFRGIRAGDLFAWLRRHVGGWLVIAAVIANMYAIMELVAKTGQGLESPFAPLLAGPPLFGAFVAQSSRLNLAALVFGCSAVVFVVDYLAPAPGTQIEPAFHVAHPATPWPTWGAYAATTITLVLVAGAIAVNRMEGADTESRTADVHEF